jgi:hypothetical protein
MAKVDRVAARIVDRILAESGFIGKSAGSVAEKRAALMPGALLAAAAIADVEDQVQKAIRPYVRGVERMIAALDRNGERIRELAERYDVGQGPRGVSEISRGLVDLDLAKFRTALVEEQPPRTANGHHQTDGVGREAPPPWHPESS